MAKLIRSTLAALFLAASVGCAGLWWRSMTHAEVVYTPPLLGWRRVAALASFNGSLDLLTMKLFPTAKGQRDVTWHVASWPSADEGSPVTPLRLEHDQRFGLGKRLKGVYLPHWYAALILALFAVGTLRVGHRFTIRSVLIITTIIATLLGMVSLSSNTRSRNLSAIPHRAELATGVSRSNLGGRW